MNVTQSTPTTPTPDSHPSYNWLQLSFGILASTLTFAGQVTIITILVKQGRKLLKPSTYYMVSLAAADLVVGVVSMPVFTISQTLGYWPFFYLSCILWNIIDYAFCFISIYTVLFIGVDRYLSVRFPLRYAVDRSMSHTAVALGAIWIVTICGVVAFLCTTQHVYGDGSQLDDRDCYMYYLDELYPTVAFCAVGIWVPTLGSLVLYSLILYEMRKARRHRRTLGSQAQGGMMDMSDFAMSFTDSSRSSAKGAVTGRSYRLKRVLSNDAKALRTMAFLLGVFCACVLPISVALVIGATRPGFRTHQFTVWTYWCVYLNSTFNPVCYAFGNPSFKAAMVKLWTRKH